MSITTACSKVPFVLLIVLFIAPAILPILSSQLKLKPESIRDSPNPVPRSCEKSPIDDTLVARNKTRFVKSFRRKGDNPRPQALLPPKCRMTFSWHKTIIDPLADPMLLFAEHGGKCVRIGFGHHRCFQRPGVIALGR